MPELTVVLERLGLTEYCAPLFDNGFHNWDAVVDITEDDMTTLNFKLGHRRLLQREIATFRGVPQSLSLEPETSSPEPTSLSTSALESFTKQTTTPPPREKRRYRRHPRADSNAPKKPKTACMRRANLIDLKFILTPRQMSTLLTSSAPTLRSASYPSSTLQEKLAEDGKSFQQRGSECGKAVPPGLCRSSKLRWMSTRRRIVGGSIKPT
jgi:hypothetical protein